MPDDFLYRAGGTEIKSCSLVGHSYSLAKCVGVCVISTQCVDECVPRSLCSTKDWLLSDSLECRGGMKRNFLPKRNS